MKTRQAWIGKKEVVEVWFDPKVIKLRALNSFAKGKKFRPMPKAEAVERLDKEQKYYLIGTALRDLPMSEAQACRVNATIQGDWKQWLSPAQLREAERLQKLQDANTTQSD